jgi:hypothetical protein
MFITYMCQGYVEHSGVLLNHSKIDLSWCESFSEYFHRVDARHQYTPELSLLQTTLVEWKIAKNFATKMPGISMHEISTHNSCGVIHCKKLHNVNARHQYAWELSLLHKTLVEWIIAKKLHRVDARHQHSRTLPPAQNSCRVNPCKKLHHIDARHQQTPKLSFLHTTLEEWTIAKNFTT